MNTIAEENMQHATEDITSLENDDNSQNSLSVDKLNTIIEFYILNFDSMDEKTKRNFSDMIEAGLRNASINELAELNVALHSGKYLEDKREGMNLTIENEINRKIEALSESENEVISKQLSERLLQVESRFMEANLELEANISARKNKEVLANKVVASVKSEEECLKMLNEEFYKLQFEKEKLDYSVDIYNKYEKALNRFNTK